MHPKESRFFLGGRQVGIVGNDGPEDADFTYAQDLVRNASTTAPGEFRNGAPASYRNFDRGYTPLNSSSTNSSSSSYVVKDGDTLRSIAEALWGDANLWWVIAEASGLTGGEVLLKGQLLSIPGRVFNLHYTNEVFRVYDPNAALGSIEPQKVYWVPPEVDDEALAYADRSPSRRQRSARTMLGPRSATCSRRCRRRGLT